MHPRKHHLKHHVQSVIKPFSICLREHWLISSTELHAVQKTCRVTVPPWSLRSGLHLAGSRVSWGREHTVLCVKKTDKVSQRFSIREPKTAFLRR